MSSFFLVHLPSLSTLSHLHENLIVKNLPLSAGEGETQDDQEALINEVYRVQIQDIQNLSEKLEIKDNRAYVTIKAELPESLDGVTEEELPLTEAGLFNTAEKGTGVMYNRVTFPTITKTNKFSLTLVWEIIF